MSKGTVTREELERRYKAIQLAIQKNAIRKWGCPVCGVRHRHGLTCKPFRLPGIAHLITTRKPK